MSARRLGAVPELPPCYSDELDACIDLINAGSAVSGRCATWKTAKERDLTAWNAAIDALPFCVESKPCAKESALAPFGAGAALGLVLGLFVATVGG